MGDAQTTSPLLPDDEYAATIHRITNSDDETHRKDLCINLHAHDIALRRMLDRYKSLLDTATTRTGMDDLVTRHMRSALADVINNAREHMVDCPDGQTTRVPDSVYLVTKLYHRINGLIVQGEKLSGRTECDGNRWMDGPWPCPGCPHCNDYCDSKPHVWIMREADKFRCDRCLQDRQW